jgi:CrcB protein
MKNCFYIGIFGFFGAILRYFIKNIHLYKYTQEVPINTILINATGSFLLALIITITSEMVEVRQEVKLGITTGFLGAYTTFSTLCKDAVILVNKGLYFSAMNYITVSIALGLFATYFGVVLAREYAYKFISKESINDVK